MNTINGYLLELFMCSSLFLLYYYLVLRNKAFNKYNRFYILCTVILSMVLPLFGFEILFEKPTNFQYFTYSYYVQDIDIPNVINYAAHTNTNLTVTNVLWFLYFLIPIISLFFICKSLLLIYNLNKKNEKISIENIDIVLTNHNSTPFSFWKTIFWNNNISLQNTEGKMIFQHELAHIKDKHTLDKILMNLVTLFFWCNPFFWIFKKELFLIHEFIADEKSGAQHNKAVWAAALLKATYPINYSPIYNSFFYSPIKRRLIMLSKTNNPGKNYLARIAALFFAIMMSIVVCVNAQQKPNEVKPQMALSKVSVIQKNLEEKVTKEIQNIDKGIIVKCDEIIIEKESKHICLIGNVDIKLKATNGKLYLNNKETTAEEVNKLSYNDISLVKIIFNDKEQSLNILEIFSYEFVRNNKIAMPVNSMKGKIDRMEASDDLNNYNFYITTRSFYGQNATVNKKEIEGVSSVNVTGIINDGFDSVKVDAKATAKTITIKNNNSNVNSITINVGDDKGQTKLKDLNKLPSLIIIDSVESTNSNLEKLNPNDIKTVNVLKGDAAIKLYGKKGENGVIIVSTKN